MKDLKRWLEDDGIPSEIRELLAAGTPPPAIDAATRVLLREAAQRLSAQATVAKLTPVPSVGKATMAIVGVALVAAGAAAGVLTVTGRTASPPLPARAPSCSASASVHYPGPGLNRSEVAPAAKAGGPVRAPPPAAGTVTELDPLDPSETIAQEAALLERARRLLGESPERALLLTDQHVESYPSGRLAAECELIAIDALVRLGRLDQARQRAAPLLVGGSGSLYAHRVRALIERSPPAPQPTGATRSEIDDSSKR